MGVGVGVGVGVAMGLGLSMSLGFGGGGGEGLGGWEKCSKASIAALFWASLEVRQGDGVSKRRPLTVTVEVKRGL